ncbi:MAG TPA: phage holin family protein [Anaerolineae bacterium]|nr:phage holin family protein [Anaerolineae bacterium]
MTLIHDFARTVFRFIVVWVVDIASLLFTAAIFPGIGFTEGSNPFIVATSAAFLLGIVNFLIRPVILLLALPFGLIAIFIVGFFLNAIALVLTAWLVPGLFVNGALDAFFGSIVLAALNTLLTSVIAVDDDDSFYQNLVERIAKREQFFALDATQGIVMMEIDGLSYHHIKKAIETGWMPTLRRMMKEEGYVLSRFDCGLPSQTSACQAGIMFGDNYDIPAFRWYDKEQQRLIVSSRDAPTINSRYAKGKGLMRDGSSVNNMMNGDARLSILTLADLLQAPEDVKQRRAQDFYLVMLNPYFFLRTLILYFGDVIREVYEGISQQLRREAPRLNRLAHFYPFLRAATTVLMRDVSAYLTILDIVRGTPALYVTWPGYDEVAHHSGPWTKDAFHTLKQYDKVIRRIKETIEHKAPRPYELIVLSDHGQSYGWTFKQRYGKSLQEFIQEVMPQGTQIMLTAGGDDGSLSVSAMAGELDNMQRRGVGGRLGKRVVRNARRVAERGVYEQERTTVKLPPAPVPSANQVTVCGSGNLAQVYFNLAPRRLTLNELNAAYPGMIDALVRHEGIGIVMAYTDDGKAIAFGKKGAHNVYTGAVTGEDPLTMYGDSKLREKQLRRLADFPHNGDLSVISTLYPDGTVAAMEELVGNHGGMGGEQTDAFIFHPADFQVPDTNNSLDVFQVLNARRGIPAPEKIQTPAPRGIDAWNPRLLAAGLVRVRKWLPLMLRSMLLDSSAYRQVAASPSMTAPALLIPVVMYLLVSLIARGEFDVVEWLVRLGAYFVGVLCAYGAARLLRGKGDFTTTLRAAGFAQSAYWVELLGLIPAFVVLARVGGLLLVFLATWMAVSQAHRLRGWRTVVLPIVTLVIGIVSVLVLYLLFRGTQMTIVELTRAMGFLPR